MNTPKQWFKQKGGRSRLAILNIILSFCSKGINILISLLLVPMTIHYVNQTRYGIWLTLSSIITWIGFFDLGLGNGMRNKFAEAKAKGNTELAKQYVSTTYFSIGTIVLILFIIISAINHFINWPVVLNVSPSYRVELREVFAFLAFFFCMNMVAKLFSSLLTADQRPGLASLIGVSGQILSLIAIFVLTRVSEGSLLNLAMFYAGIPTISLLLWTIIAYSFTRYKQFTPKLKYFRPILIKDIFNIGIQFFIIYLCLIAIFQIINIVISRELGPESVTQYNIAHKYFSIIYSIAIIIISPFWSAFTDAYHKQDTKWMFHVKAILEKLWLCAAFAILIMLFFSKQFYHLWVGDEIKIETNLSLGMAIFVVVQCLGAIYMNLINGIGTVRLQLIIYVIFAIISYPLMVFSAHHWGLNGILIAPSLCYLIQALLGRIQINKLLHSEAKGLWGK